jgi:hypothetical protein
MDGIAFASQFRTEVINSSGQFISNVRRHDVVGQNLSAMILDGVVVDQVKMVSRHGFQTRNVRHRSYQST